MPPFLGGGSMIRRVRLEGFEPADLPAKFEAGTPPIVPAIGLGAAIDYLNRVGLEAIHAHEQLLTRRAHEVLDAVGGVRFLGPSPEKKAGIVSFTVEGVHAHDVAQLLDRHGVAIRAGHHCAMPLHKRLGITASNRASFYFYNTPAEVDRLGEALDEAKRVFRRK
jgi:cysteine desulfurase/selenocysteine lyase